MKFFALPALLLIISILSAGELTVTWEAPTLDPEVVETPLGQYFRMPGAMNTGSPGDPSLPSVPVYIALPPGSIVDSVSICGFQEVSLFGSYDIKPVQTGVPISRPELFSITPRNSASYTDTGRRDVVILDHQGSLMGHSILGIILNPLHWDPATGRAFLASSITLTVHYQSGFALVSPQGRGITGNRVSDEMVSRMVLNPADASCWTLPEVPSRDLPWGEYLIITRDSLVPVFEQLAQFKTMTGIPSQIVTMEYVNLSYAGVDEAQKLRFFLRDIYDETPPTYILLGGDTPLVPHRNCWATAEGYTGNPAADIYFQDMNDAVQGVDLWDANENGVWGELEGDEMDYHPDYIIGRAAVSNSSEANTFVSKVLAFQRPSLSDSRDTDPWFTSMGFTTGILWSNPYCPGSAGKEKVDTLYTPIEWQPIIKHYQSNGSQSYALTMEMLNQGMQLVNHSGHGSEGSVSIGNGSLGSGDFLGLTNISAHGRPSIWNTIACLSGSFDTGSCLAEAWINSPQGGGFCMMNTRYGWGEPSEPGDRWSELVDQEFFAKFFTEDFYHLGEAHAMAWDEFIPLIPTDTHYDWIAKSITLFGDPELPMWSLPPDGALDVTGPDTLGTGVNNITVTVEDGSGLLQGARVCVIQGEWDNPLEYQVQYTNGAGQASLSLNIADDTDTAALTVWSRNHLSVTIDIPISGTGITGPDTGELQPLLSNPFPNPTLGSVDFQWGVPTGIGSITIHDIAGRMITVVESKLSGTGTVQWNCRTSTGERVPEGMYFARLDIPGETPITRQLIVLR